MTGHDLDRLPPRERQVLELLLTRGEATAVDLQEALDGDLGNSTVRKMLTRLEAKGLVTYRRDGMRYVYRPSVRRQRARRHAMTKLIRVFFDGSPGRAALAMLDGADSDLSDEELDELAKIVDQARRRQK